MESVTQQKLCHTHKSAEAATRSWDNIKKVLSIIEFSQKAWLKSYVDTNTELRTKDINVFEKEFLKMMNSQCPERLWTM